MNTALSLRRRNSAVRNFARHYVEMLIAMFVGMAALGFVAELALSAAGGSSSQLQDDAPAAMLLGMAFNMTVPMVGWMRYRGHGWPASIEMAASMFIPTFAAIGLLGAGLVGGIGTALMIQHVAMFPSMLVAMLLRRDEYSSGAHHHGVK
jgi:hypothetical protein